ncbi:bifunctional demethylmenaquinone methyltransferase/2-methoxy-6-polyprenyl-1,4-benzoquinol methylase UbiE [Planctomicrobium sp. SH661]|uniref:bifunctional demethylmenaquinone methyltransferase/2-methoxy-6-polyprenyl-1,4-benzoquinol methylase UbiE n=1 Tax=Planctomicrobium sp. SH661 TaxID=3448124 RepID=UPI003F5C39CE
MSHPSTAATPRVDKSGDRVRKMFGEISQRYDLMNHLLSGGVDIYWRSYTVRQVPPIGTAPLLDVCTGTGDLALAYWNAGKRKIPVFGTDFTPEMLAIARTKFEKVSARDKDAAGVTFTEADTQHLPYPDDHFQIVSVAFGLRNVSDTRAGLREMIRVCQPGGRVAVLEFAQPTLPGLAGFYRWYFKNVLPRIGQLFAKNREDAYNYLPASVSEFPCGTALVEIMSECGLKEVTYTPLTFGIAALYVGVK